MKRILLFIPALAGLLFHAPLYYFTKWLGNSLIKEDSHGDSKLIGFLFILYPVYLLLLLVISYIVTGSWLAIILLLILPFTVWSYVQVKKQLD